MSNLVPEKRVDRLGRSITRWVRSSATTPDRSVLGKVLPAISPAAASFIEGESEAYAAKHAELSERIRLIIQKEIEFDPKDRSLFRDPETRQQDAERLKADLTAKAEEAMMMVQGFEISTLQVLCAQMDGTQMMMNSIRYHLDELELREGLHYARMKNTFSPRPPFPEFLEAIRTSLGVDDLTVYPEDSKEHAAIMAVLELMFEDNFRRVKEDDAKFRNGPTYWKLERTPTPKVVIDAAKLADLIETLRQYPDRENDIEAFLIQNKLELGEADYDYLRVHLENAAPALGDGIL